MITGSQHNHHIVGLAPEGLILALGKKPRAGTLTLRVLKQSYALLSLGSSYWLILRQSVENKIANISASLVKVIPDAPPRFR